MDLLRHPPRPRARRASTAEQETATPPPVPQANRRRRAAPGPQDLYVEFVLRGGAAARTGPDSLDGAGDEIRTARSQAARGGIMLIHTYIGCLAREMRQEVDGVPNTGVMLGEVAEWLRCNADESVRGIIYEIVNHELGIFAGQGRDPNGGRPVVDPSLERLPAKAGFGWRRGVLLREWSAFVDEALDGDAKDYRIIYARWDHMWRRSDPHLVEARWVAVRVLTPEQWNHHAFSVVRGGGVG